MPSKPRRLRDRRTGKEKRLANFQPFKEFARLTRAGRGMTYEMVPGNDPGSLHKTYPHAFMVAHPLDPKVPNQPVPLVALIGSRQSKKNRFYYEDRRRGETRRRGKETKHRNFDAGAFFGSLMRRTVGKGSNIIVRIAEDADPKVLGQKGLRVFETSAPVEGASLIATAVTSKGSRYFYLDRRDRRLNKWRRRDLHTYYNATLDELLQTRQGITQEVYVLTTPAPVPASTRFPELFESYRKLRGRNLMATLQRKGIRKIFVYAGWRRPFKRD